MVHGKMPCDVDLLSAKKPAKCPAKQAQEIKKIKLNLLKN
jgi:hypothetical protein